MANETMLSVKNLTKQFGKLKAVDDLSFDIEKGEIMGLVGPNGAGKTTLFNMVNGLYKPTKGKVFFKEEDITGLPPFDICHMGIGRSYQVPKPFGSLTLYENCLVAAQHGSGLGREEAREKVLEVLKFMDLYEKRNFLPEEIGIVDLKRLEVARGLSTSPDLLLLDEMAGGLTPEEVKEAQKLVKSINKDMEITIFLIEHVIPMVTETVDRLVVISEGSKIAEGDPEECFEKEEVIKSYLGG